MSELTTLGEVSVKYADYERASLAVRLISTCVPLPDELKKVVEDCLIKYFKEQVK